MKIICPTCGTVLNVKYIEDIESKSFVCLNCKHKHIVGKCRRLDEVTPLPAADHPTQYSSDVSQPTSEATQYVDDACCNDATKIATTKNLIGQLIIDGSKDPDSDKPTVLVLHPGENVIGRASKDSTADLQIKCTDKRMSREHLLVEVKSDPVAGFVHCIKLYKEPVNDTFIQGNKMAFGDTYVLNDGDEIQLPGVKLIFKI